MASHSSKIAALLVALSCVGAAHADTWAVVKETPDGPVVSYVIKSGKHTLGPNEYPADYVFPDAPTRYWKKSGNDWVVMSQAEKDAVDAVNKEDVLTFDPVINAILEALAPELKMTKEELKTKVKSKLSADAADKAKKKEKQ